jgi:NADH:ubiquinone oxidoreductase subunit K
MTPSIPIIAGIVILGLLGIGLYALLAVRNLIKMIIALQIMVKGVLVAFILAGRLRGDMALAQSMALTIIVSDTIVAVIGLALAVQIRRHAGTLDIKALTTLRR